MQTDASSLTYAIPFFISVISWVKMIRDKKKIYYITEYNQYFENKIENLEVIINKNETSIFNMNNEIDYIYELLTNMKSNIKLTLLKLENITKINDTINTCLSNFEIVNENLYELEQRIKEIENKSLSVTEKISLKIINPDFLINDDMYCNYKQCQSPYHIIYTSSSTNISSTLSPLKTNEWETLP